MCIQRHAYHKLTLPSTLQRNTDHVTRQIHFVHEHDVASSYTARLHAREVGVDEVILQITVLVEEHGPCPGRAEAQVASEVAVVQVLVQVWQRRHVTRTDEHSREYSCEHSYQRSCR